MRCGGTRLRPLCVGLAFRCVLTRWSCFTQSSRVPESLSNAAVREIVGIDLAEPDAEALGGWYAGFARGVAAFPAADLKRVVPPLVSTPGPVVR